MSPFLDVFLHVCSFSAIRLTNDSGSESDSHSDEGLEEPQDPELELNMAIEAFLSKLETIPQPEWPSEDKKLLELVEPHCKVLLTESDLNLNSLTFLCLLNCLQGFWFRKGS